MPAPASTTSAQSRLADARAFAEDVVRAGSRDWDRAASGMDSALRAAIDAGLLAPDLRIVDEDADPVTALRIVESLAWGCAGFTYAAHAAGLAARTIATLGTPEQTEQLLPLVTSTRTELRMGALAVSEPGAGSDVAAIATTAVRDGEEYILTGRKTFITNALDANAIIVYATTDRSLGWAGLSPYVVPRNAPGVEISPIVRAVGLRAGRFGDITLNECRIPADHSLGSPDGRPSLAGLRMLDASRPGTAAIAVGLAQAAYDYSREYAQGREQFGRPIATQQSIAFNLVDMAMDIHAARLMTWDAAEAAQRQDADAHVKSSMAKCFATERAMQAATTAVQILGGPGCTEAHPVEKWMRDAKLLEICEGPSQIQRLIVSRAILHP